MHKLIIATNTKSGEQTSDLMTTCLVMDEYQVIAIYAASEVEVSYDAEDLLDSHLYPDCFDPDEIDIEINENCRGLSDIMDGLLKFMSIWFDEDKSVVYGYDIDLELMELMNDEIGSVSEDMIMQDYHSIFRDGRDIERDITDIMTDYHINAKLINPGSQVSMLYFLGALMEKIHNN